MPESRFVVGYYKLIGVILKRKFIKLKKKWKTYLGRVECLNKIRRNFVDQTSNDESSVSVTSKNCCILC